MCSVCFLAQHCVSRCFQENCSQYIITIKNRLQQIALFLHFLHWFFSLCGRMLVSWIQFFRSVSLSNMYNLYDNLMWLFSIELSLALGSTYLRSFTNCSSTKSITIHHNFLPSVCFKWRTGISSWATDKIGHTSNSKCDRPEKLAFKHPEM